MDFIVGLIIGGAVIGFFWWNSKTYTKEEAKNKKLSDEERVYKSMYMMRNTTEYDATMNEIALRFAVLIDKRIEIKKRTMEFRENRSK